MSLAFELLALAGLILLNGFFVAAEYGLVTSRRTRIMELEHQGNRRLALEIVERVGENPLVELQLGARDRIQEGFKALFAALPDQRSGDDLLRLAVPRRLPERVA